MELGFKCEEEYRTLFKSAAKLEMEGQVESTALRDTADIMWSTILNLKKHLKLHLWIKHIL